VVQSEDPGVDQIVQERVRLVVEALAQMGAVKVEQKGVQALLVQPTILQRRRPVQDPQNPHPPPTLDWQFLLPQNHPVLSQRPLPLDLQRLQPLSSLNPLFL
tara:strand:- start:223 stop:528 length:306 start_codon:yes stop_codon:yes gene_type:complete